MYSYLESLEFWQGNSLAALKWRDFWFDHAAPSPLPFHDFSFTLFK